MHQQTSIVSMAPLKIVRRATCLAAVLATSQAGEIGHFTPGVPSIRDFAMPEPGFYGVLYNYGYATDRLNDQHGDAVRSITTRSGATVDVTSMSMSMRSPQR